jgi:hypothetical protein
MTRTRISLITAGIIAGALAVQGLILWVWSTALDILGFGLVITQIIGPNLFVGLLVAILHYAAFGIGVFLALRYFAPIGASNSWRLTTVRAITVSVSGAVVAFAFSAIVSLIAAVTIGAYPFGYSLDAAVDGWKAQYGIQNAIAGAVSPLIEWLPLTVLGCVFLKLWVGAHPSTVEPKDRASVSA